MKFRLDIVAFGGEKAVRKLHNELRKNGIDVFCEKTEYGKDIAYVDMEDMDEFRLLRSVLLDSALIVFMGSDTNIIQVQKYF